MRSLAGRPRRNLLTVIPASRTITLRSKGWRLVELGFGELGSDGHDVQAVSLAGGPARGDFSFAIDDVRLD